MLNDMPLLRVDNLILFCHPSQLSMGTSSPFFSSAAANVPSKFDNYYVLGYPNHKVMEVRGSILEPIDSLIQLTQTLQICTCS
jgi:hypothetical protein